MRTPAPLSVGAQPATVESIKARREIHALRTKSVMKLRDRLSILPSPNPWLLTGAALLTSSWACWLSLKSRL